MIIKLLSKPKTSEQIADYQLDIFFQRTNDDKNQRERGRAQRFFNDFLAQNQE